MGDRDLIKPLLERHGMCGPGPLTVPGIWLTFSGRCISHCVGSLQV